MSLWYPLTGLAEKSLLNCRSQNKDSSMILMWMEVELSSLGKNCNILIQNPFEHSSNHSHDTFHSHLGN